MQWGGGFQKLQCYLKVSKLGSRLPKHGVCKGFGTLAGRQGTRGGRQGEFN